MRSLAIPELETEGVQRRRLAALRSGTHRRINADVSPAGNLGGPAVQVHRSAWANVVFRGSPGELFDVVRESSAKAGLTLSEGPPNQGTVALLCVPEEGSSEAETQLDDARSHGFLGVVIAIGYDTPRLWEWAINHAADHVVPLPQGEQWLTEFLVGTQRSIDEAPLIVVMGGHGGAGATTVATLLAAHCASKNARTLLMDCDPTGAGVHTYVGQRPRGLTWADLATSQGRIDASQLAEFIPSVKRLSVLGFDEGERGDLPRALPAVLSAARAGYEVVVADVPYSHAVNDFWLKHSSRTVVVVQLNTAGIVAARRKLALAQSNSIAVVARGSYPEGLDAKSLSKVLGAEVLARVPQASAVGRATERGMIVEALRERRIRRALDAVIEALAARGSEER